MRLTRHSDYALRVLLFVGAADGRLVTVGAIAERFGISRNHLMKVVNRLAVHGFVETVRGKHGGIRLAVAPEALSLGALLRHTEGDFALTECFSDAGQGCRIAGSCAVRGVLGEALAAFLAVLDRYTLADLLHNRGALAEDLSLTDWRVMEPG
ncbi:MAG: RrF2 family transcriptional regulator [Halorhodospira sp.]